MPGLTGVEAAKQIAQLDEGEDWRLPEIVFITAYDQYAVEAFEQGVADYVLKPAERERLQLTAERLKKRLARAHARRGRRARRSPAAAAAQALKQPAGTRAARRATWSGSRPASATEIQMIPVAEVLFFISDEKYTRVQTEQHRGADPQADQGAGRRARPASVLADPPQHPDQRQGHRRHHARFPRPPDRQRQGRHPEKLEVSRSYTHLFKGM
jgi:hypothetical protein